MRRTSSTVVVTLIAAALLLTGCGKKATSSQPGLGSTGGGSVGTAPVGTSGPVPAGVGGSPSTLNGVPVDANGCATSNAIGLAKTKFALHAGLTFGTFHRYLYKPFKAGSFSSGAKGRVAALVKAGVTALFDAHEIRVATEDVKANPTLCRVIAAPLRELASTLDGVGSRIKGGDTSGLDQANTQAAAITARSSMNGQPITETTDQSTG